MLNFDDYTVSFLDNYGNIMHRGTLLSRNNNLLLIKGTDLPILPKGKQVRLTLQHPMQGVKHIDGQVEIATDIQINVLIKNETAFVERRMSLKVPTDIRFSISNMKHRDEEIEFDKPMNISVLNLSLGGMLISPDRDYEFSLGDSGYFEFNPYPQYLLSIEFEIVRVDNIGDFSVYGCRFFGMMPGEEDILCKYIYDRQLEMRKPE